MRPIEQSVLTNLKNVKESIELVEGHQVNLKFQLEVAIENIDDVYKEGYDEGFKVGSASVVVPNPEDPSEKLYSQADMDAAVNPLKDQVAGLTASLEAAQADIASEKAKLESAMADLEILKNDMNGRVAQEVTAIKASMKEAYLAQQALESASEADLLKVFD